MRNGPERKWTGGLALAGLFLALAAPFGLPYLTTIGLTACGVALGWSSARRLRVQSGRVWQFLGLAGLGILLAVGIVFAHVGSAAATTAVAVAAGLLTGALLASPGPGPTAGAERRLLVMDSSVAAVACAVVVGFVAQAAPHPDGGAVALAVGTWVMMSSAVFVACRARRPGGLPFAPLVLLLGAAAAVIIGALLLLADGLVSGPAGILWAAAATAATLAALRGPEEVETAGQARARQYLGLAAPMVPVAVALCLTAWAAAVGLQWSGPARWAAAAVLGGFLATVIVWRVWAATGWRTQLDEQALTSLRSPTGQAWFRALAAEAQDLITVTDSQGIVVFQTPSVERALGFEPGHFRERTWLDMVAVDDQPAALQVMEQARAAAGRAVRTTLTLSVRGGTTRSVRATVTALGDEGLPGGYVVSARDVTTGGPSDGRSSRAEDVDALTGLTSRAALLRDLRRATAAAAAGRLAVLSIDIDGFRGINDSYGTQTGDYVLRQVAKALRRCVRPWDLVSRLGGDEFVVVVAGPNAERSVARIHERLVHHLAAVVSAQGDEISLSFSAGYSVADSGADTPEDLLRNAGLAMARARTSRDVAVLRFDAQMHEALLARVTAEQELRRALSRRELHLVYQPIVDLRDGAVVGVEALARWRHPERGEVPAAEFVPLVEDLGLAGELGQWVLQQACRDVARLRSRGVWPDGARVNVNVSAQQIGPELPAQITAAVLGAGVHYADVTLEITESVLADHLGGAGKVLSQVRQQGCLVALDDFGTGYSSLAYLAQLPVDVLKIDRSFVHGADESPHFVTLTRMIIGLAQALGLTCVAEGVEADGQYTMLAGLGCARGQGFLFQRPVPAERLEGLLTEHDGAVALPPNPARLRQ